MFSRQFARMASTTAKKSTLKLYGVDGTYATALFDVAVKESRVPEVATGLQSLSSQLASDAKLNHIFLNPALSLQDRKTVVQTIVAAGGKTEPALANFLGVLAENNRLDQFSKIAANFGKLTDDYNGVVNASVTTVAPMEGKLLKRIEKALQGSKFVGQGKTLRLQNQVDPQIKGGLIVEIDEKTVDLSVAARLQKLNKILEETV